MRSRALAVSILLSCYASASAVPGLLKPEVQAEAERLRDDPSPAARRRAAEIAQARSDYMQWKTAAEKTPPKAREDWASLAPQTRNRLSAQLEAHIETRAFSGLMEDLSSAPASAGEGEDDGSWVDALLEFLKRPKPNGRG